MTRILAILGTTMGLGASLAVWMVGADKVGWCGLIAVVGLIVAERATRKLGRI